MPDGGREPALSLGGRFTGWRADGSTTSPRKTEKTKKAEGKKMTPTLPLRKRRGGGKEGKKAYLPHCSSLAQSRRTPIWRLRLRSLPFG